MTIINLAQDYVGSNNLNLLMPNGQYGTRDQGGKDHASPRYIFTEPSAIARAVLHPQDDPLLTYLKDDNDPIEPEYYMPVIPLVLVNGAEGIGTGASCACTVRKLWLLTATQAGARPSHATTQQISSRTYAG
jgi:DNA topoisomerase-2